MSQQKNPSEKLPLVQHLIELRRSLLRSVIAIAIFFLILFPFADEIYNFIAAPIVQAIPGSNLIAIGVISPFLTPLKMSLILAIYIAMPFLLYQLWMFVAPALYRHEKRLILPLVISSTILFYVGLVFSFYVVFPVIFGFLAGVGPESVNFAPDIQYYLDFILKVLEEIVFGCKRVDFRLILIGSRDEEYDQALAPLISKLKDYIVEVPFLSNEKLVEYYSKADWGIWPGIPSNTIQEAMACETAIVLPDNKAVSHLVDGNGFLIKDSQEEIEVAKKIVEYSSYKKELSKMKDRSSSLAQKYSWENIAKESLEVYGER